ncbi:hypothetical protein E3U55_07205 [Filobacillus milosensis]|uniref:Lia operon protein LiaF n=1 Tax=Filobacillus milosensis TaxID=94137 RepID=A0A4Y8IT38_9BACI|nr:cell wall-active antibiotics response protein LiaF [Filobacillus milosensis]TFB22082.1 hypothetical protein E3U55_07205 [Filobacillus milosensis]
MFSKLFSKIAKLTIAFIFIGFGVVLILQNLNIISLEMSNTVWNSWPIILVIIGLISFSNYFIPHKSGSWKFGSFLVVFGGLLWAGNFDYVEFTFIDVWKLWPLILVYIGANILAGKKTVSIYVDSSEGEVNKGDSIIETDSKDDAADWTEPEEPLAPDVAKDFKDKKHYGQFKYHINKRKHLISDLNFSADNWKVKDMDIWTGIGDLNFDFSKGYIPNQETKIRLRGYIADIQMKLPENVAYRIYANINLGEVTIFDEERSGFGSSISYESENYETATKKIEFHLDYKIGDIKIHSV